MPDWLETQTFMPQLKLQEAKWCSEHLRSGLLDSLPVFIAGYSRPQKAKHSAVVGIVAVVLTVWGSVVASQEKDSLMGRGHWGVLCTLLFCCHWMQRLSVFQGAISQLISASQHHGLQNARGHSAGVSSRRWSFTEGQGHWQGLQFLHQLLRAYD